MKDPKHYSTILEDINIKVSDMPIIVAIAGFGSSGKTTLAKKLAKDIPGSVVISINDFIINHLTRRGADWEGFDWNRLTNEVLEPVSQGEKSITYGVYDWDSNSIIEQKTHEKITVVILEGVGLLQKELINYFHYSIWLDCPIEIAYQRGLGREAYDEHHDHWLGIWLPNDLDYYVKHQPHTLADALYSTV